MTARGWTPVRHFLRDALVLVLTVIATVVIQRLTEDDSPKGADAETTWETTLLAIGALSGAMAGSSIIVTTLIVGWWDKDRLSWVAGIPVYGNTILLLLRANTWLLASLTAVSLGLVVLPLSKNIEAVLTPAYAALAITSANYFRRTISVLYKAAVLVTKSNT